MNNKHISAIILATTLSFGGTSYVMAESQQGIKNGQGCATQMQNNETQQPPTEVGGLVLRTESPGYRSKTGWV